MALFGKADADLPVLSRLYQCAELPEELRTFLDRADGGPKSESDIEPYYEAYYALEHSELGLFFCDYKQPNAQDMVEQSEPLSQEDYRSLTDRIINDPLSMRKNMLDVAKASQKENDASVKFMRSMQRLQIVVKHVMDALADDTSVSLKFLRDLRECMLLREVNYAWYKGNKRRWAQSVEDEGMSEEEVDSHAVFRARDLSLVPRGDFDSSTHLQILDELSALLSEPHSHEGKIVVRRCTECNSPYISQRRDQIFCSHRCANRVSSRKSMRRVRQQNNKKVMIAKSTT